MKTKYIKVIVLFICIVFCLCACKNNDINKDNDVSKNDESILTTEKIKDLDELDDNILNCETIELVDAIDKYEEKLNITLTEDEVKKFKENWYNNTFYYTGDTMSIDILYMPEYKLLFKDKDNNILSYLYIDQSFAYMSLTDLEYYEFTPEGPSPDENGNYIQYEDWIEDMFSQYLTEDLLCRVPNEKYLNALSLVDYCIMHKDSNDGIYDSETVFMTKSSINNLNSYKCDDFEISTEQYVRQEASSIPTIDDPSYHNVYYPKNLKYDLSMSSDKYGTLYNFYVTKNGSIYTKYGYEIKSKSFKKLINSLKPDKSTLNKRTLVSEKPIIYLYPEEETNVTVKLSNPDNLICDYPEYNSGWNVIAKPNGDLKDLNSGKNLYCLYYESNHKDLSLNESGFVIKKENTSEFLDEKLKILGLNDKERNEFIIYWLPQLEQNNYNFIHFLTEEEINQIQELNINPTPDNIIRVFMSFKGLDNPIKVKEQKLSAPNRSGFTVVEWGGIKL